VLKKRSSQWVGRVALLQNLKNQKEDTVINFGLRVIIRIDIQSTTTALAQRSSADIDEVSALNLLAALSNYPVLRIFDERRGPFLPVLPSSA
jgi:hypothetical protein